MPNVKERRNRKILLRELLRELLLNTPVFDSFIYTDWHEFEGLLEYLKVRRGFEKEKLLIPSFVSLKDVLNPLVRVFIKSVINLIHTEVFVCCCSL